MANGPRVGASEDLHIASPSNEAHQLEPVLMPDWAILPTLDMMTDVLQHLVSLGVGVYSTKQIMGTIILQEC
jgi:hypothetical protein